MTKTIIEHIIQMILVSPIIFLTLKDRKAGTLKILLVFGSFFIAHVILLYVPLEFEELNFINGKWNWSGKIYAICGALIFLSVYKKFELKDYYLTLKQNASFKKKGVLVLLIIFLLYTIKLYFASPQNWNLETVLYQLTMPGIDEEIAYRGIMLGLLTKILKPTFKNIIFHPAIIVTAILFGLAHGFQLNTNYELNFKIFPFFNTLFLGFIWGWLTMKSGSILFALISHNLGNVSNKLIRML